MSGRGPVEVFAEEVEGADAVDGVGAVEVFDGGAVRDLE
jgi:hypothetical protein